MYCTIVHNLSEQGQHADFLEAEVVVVGGGVVGVSTALALAGSGVDVALVEREPAGAAAGSSKGGARIFAPAPHPDASYLEMGVAALARWREIESRSGRELLVRTGTLTTGGFAERLAAALDAIGQPVEVLAADEVRRRFGVETGGRDAVHQPDAGIIHAASAHATLLELAARDGVALHHGEAVTGLEPAGEGVEVTTTLHRWRSRSAVIVAGPWTIGLVRRCGIELDATVSAQTVVHLGLRDHSRPPVALMDFDGDEPYALWDPQHGLKVAFHARGLRVDDPSHPPAIDPGVAEELEVWAYRAYPGAVLGRIGVEGCFYTRTPRERFAIERHGPIVVVAACNGQGFQFAPHTGELAARVATRATEVGAA